MKKAICILQNKGIDYGKVLFQQCCIEHPIRINFDLKNFFPMKEHAIHIHKYGDLSDGCKSLGPHYNPENVTHGSYLYPKKPRHAGDLINNFTANEYGNFLFSYNDEKLRSIHDIVGRSVVIHAGIDDCGQGNNSKRAESLISGNAGERIVCGIIGWKSSI